MAVMLEVSSASGDRCRLLSEPPRENLSIHTIYRFLELICALPPDLRDADDLRILRDLCARLDFDAWAEPHWPHTFSTEICAWLEAHWEEQLFLQHV